MIETYELFSIQAQGFTVLVCQLLCTMCWRLIGTIQYQGLCVS